MKFTKWIEIREMMGSVGSIVSCRDLNNPNFQVQGALSNYRCGKKWSKKNKVLKMKFNKNESVSSKLSDIATIKTNYPEADFWITRKGSENVIGKPTKEFSPENIGVKVTSEDLLPDYLFYAILHLQMKGYFRQLAHGTLSLKNIKVSDIENIPIG